MPRLCALALAVCALAASPAAGGPAARAADLDPRALSLAQRYLKDAQAERILDGEGPTVARYMLSKIPEPAGGPAKAEEAREAMIEAADAAVKAKLPEFLRRSSEVYAKIFTVKELEDIVAFYESASGRAFVAKTSDASAPIAEIIRALGDDIQVDARRRFCAREAELCRTAPSPARPGGSPGGF